MSAQTSNSSNSQVEGKNQPSSVSVASKNNSSQSQNSLLATQKLSNNQLLGINLLTRQIIQEQLRILVAENLHYLKVERQRRIEVQQRLKAEEEQRKKWLEFASKMSFYLNFYFIIGVLMLLTGLGGLLIGVNLAPIADCQSVYLCKTLRLRQ